MIAFKVLDLLNKLLYNESIRRNKKMKGKELWLFAICYTVGMIGGVVLALLVLKSLVDLIFC